MFLYKIYPSINLQQIYQIYIKCIIYNKKQLNRVQSACGEHIHCFWKGYLMSPEDSSNIAMQKQLIYSPKQIEHSFVVIMLYRIIALLSEPAPLSNQLKARFEKFICKALVHDTSTLKFVTKLACQNPMSVSGRNWRDCIHFAQLRYKYN